MGVVERFMRQSASGGNPFRQRGTAMNDSASSGLSAEDWEARKDAIQQRLAEIKWELDELNTGMTEENKSATLARVAELDMELERLNLEIDSMIDLGEE